jgi:hypothetical protein
MKADAAAVRVRSGSARYLVVANRPGDELRIAGQTLRARIALFEQDKESPWRVRHLAP